MSQVRRLAALVAVGMMIGLGLGTAARSAPAPSAATPVADKAAPAAGNDLALAQALSRNYSELFGKYRSAVVRITVPSKEDGRDIVKFWTGFFINRDGYVLTANANQLQDSVRVSVMIDDFPYYAEVKGLDPVTNLALLRVVAPPKDFAVVDIAGDTATPLLATLLLGVTCKQLELPGPSAGMVQGYNSNYETLPLPTMYLRVTIQDDGGEIGSPVFDLQGRFQGIMVLSLPVLHSSLVLPARAVSRVTDELLKSGKVIYGRMGIEAKPIRDGETGIRLQLGAVGIDGPARNGGLKADDIILSIDGVQIRTHDDMRQAAFFARPGQIVTVRIRRAAQEIDLPLMVAELPLDTPSPTLPGVPGPLPPASVNTNSATPRPPAGNITGNTTTVAPETTPTPLTPTAETKPQ